MTADVIPIVKPDFRPPDVQLIGWLNRLHGDGPFSRAGFEVFGEAYLAGRVAELEQALAAGNWQSRRNSLLTRSVFSPGEPESITEKRGSK